MKMKKYLEPSVALLALATEDVITASGDPVEILSPLTQEGDNDFGGFNAFQ